MPIIKQYNLANGCHAIVWQITETLDWLQNNLIATEEEWRFFETISHPQKQLEWLAGRKALQTLAAQLNLTYKGTFKDDFGKPYLIDNQVHISLTNTAKFVAVALHFEQPVGIDMEKISPKLQIIAHKFLSETEFHSSQKDLLRLAFCWCSKEAIYKLFGQKKVSFKDHIFIPTQQNEVGVLEINNVARSYSLFQFQIEDFYGVVAV